MLLSFLNSAVEGDNWSDLYPAEGNPGFHFAEGLKGPKSDLGILKRRNELLLEEMTSCSKK